MKPLPNLEDERAMLERGRRSALGSARNEAAELLRNEITFIQAADWSRLIEHIAKAEVVLDRLKTLTAMWNEL